MSDKKINSANKTSEAAEETAVKTEAAEAEVVETAEEKAEKAGKRKADGDSGKNKKKFNSKKLKHGAMATVFTCVFVAVIVLINVVATMLFDRYPITFDLTENKVYSVSEDSEDYVKSIDVDVYITVLATEEDFRNIVYGSDYTRQASELLKRYQQYNTHISVKYVDFLSNPDILSDYTETQTLNQYDIIFETRSADDEGNDFKRISIVQPMDLINLVDEFEETLTYYYGSKEAFITMAGSNAQAFSMCTYYGADESSNVESAFTSALMKVADKNAVKVTFLNANRNETDVAYFKSLLEANAYIVDEINISTDDIPEDTNIVVIPAPRVDYTSDEITKVDKFLDNDGRLGKHLLYIASIEQGETPNLDEFLEEYGLKIERNIIGELDSNYYYYGNPYATVQYIIGENYLADFNQDASAQVYMPFARVVTPLFEEDGMKRTEKYLSSSTNATAVNIDDESKYEQRGALCSMAFGSKVRFADDLDENSANKYSHIIAFGSDYFFRRDNLGAPQFKNSDFIISLLNGVTDKTQDIIITPKAVGAVRFDINEKQANILKYTYIFIIPGIILITGLVVYIRRKNK